MFKMQLIFFQIDLFYSKELQCKYFQKMHTYFLKLKWKLENPQFYYHFTPPEPIFSNANIYLLYNQNIFLSCLITWTLINTTYDWQVLRCKSHSDKTMLKFCDFWNVNGHENFLIINNFQMLIVFWLKQFWVTYWVLARLYGGSPTRRLLTIDRQIRKSKGSSCTKRV